MSDLLRMTGMYSGMDTEAIIQQMLKAKAQKVTNLKNDQKKLEWKQTLWQDLNKRIYKLYTGTLSNMRLEGSYAKKKTKVSDPTKATITASEGAVNGSQSLEVKKLAKSGYLTGATVSKQVDGYIPIYNKDTASAPSDGSNELLASLGVGKGTLTVDAGGTQFNVTVDGTERISDFVTKFNNEAQSAGAQITMSYSEGKITVDGPTSGAGDGSFGFEMSSSPIESGFTKTILQGLGLSNVCAKGDNASGKVTGEAITRKGLIYEEGNFKADSKLSEITKDLVGRRLFLTVGEGKDAKITTIDITSDMTISDFTRKLQEGGVNASFDEKNQRFFISSSGTGKANEFKLEGDKGAHDALLNLGLDMGDDQQEELVYPNGSKATRIKAQDGEIILNGATFTSDTNTFTVNGLSITANALTEEAISITTETDYDGIYDMIKDFVAEYNDIMNEMTKLYGADSSRKFTMLSDEEKEAMSEDEVEKWEGTIKDSLLRRDKDLNNVMQCMIGAINKGYDIGGKTLYLVNFGIGTAGYFESEKAERNALHIFGDSDDDKFSEKDNDLKAALAEDPEQVISLFTEMSKEMYTSLRKTMDGTDYRSVYKVYDDKRMKIEYDDYTKKIKEAEKKLNAYEDKWYKKFSAMEVALSKLQSSQNSLASMLGQ